MFEHPYFTYQISRFEREEAARRAERKRFLEEHADQIVRTSVGPVGRMLRRLGAAFGARRRSARSGSSRPSVPARSSASSHPSVPSGPSVSSRTSGSSRLPVPSHPSGSSRPSVPCEPATVR